MCYNTHFLRIYLTKYYIVTPYKSITCKRCKLQTSTSVHVLLCIWETVVGRKADNSLKCPSDEGKKNYLITLRHTWKDREALGQKQQNDTA